MLVCYLDDESHNGNFKMVKSGTVATQTGAGAFNTTYISFLPEITKAVKKCLIYKGRQLLMHWTSQFWNDCSIRKQRNIMLNFDQFSVLLRIQISRIQYVSSYCSPV